MPSLMKEFIKNYLELDQLTGGNYAAKKLDYYFCTLFRTSKFFCVQTLDTQLLDIEMVLVSLLTST